MAKMIDLNTLGAETIVRTVRDAIEKAGRQVRSLREWPPAE